MCRSDVDWHSIPCFNRFRRGASGGGSMPSGSQAARMHWSPSVSPPLPPPPASQSSPVTAAPVSMPTPGQTTEVEDFGPAPGGRGGAGEFHNLQYSGNEARSSRDIHPNVRDRRTIPEDERQPDPLPQRRKGGNPPHERKGSKGGKGSGNWGEQQWRGQWSSSSWSGSAWKKGRWEGY